MAESEFNGVNSNFIPTPSSIVPLPEMDRFVVEETADGPVVVRKKRDASEDLGNVDAYSLSSMIKNGVDPSSFRINTSSVSRLDGMSAFDRFASSVDDVMTTPDSVSTSEPDTNK